MYIISPKPETLNPYTNPINPLSPLIRGDAKDLYHQPVVRTNPAGSSVLLFAVREDGCRGIGHGFIGFRV